MRRKRFEAQILAAEIGMLFSGSQPARPAQSQADTGGWGERVSGGELLGQMGISL